MRLQNTSDYTTLTWVKPELDETLRQARNALQIYVEEGEDVTQLKDCASFLHQVHGTLRMVELYGAAMVADEMEQLTKALIADQVSQRDEAYGVLMQAIVQLPDYLERLQTGHRDIPIVLLPLLNQLRANRGEQGLSESLLFSPDLSRPLPASARGPLDPLPLDQLTRRAEVLRGLYQSALLRWMKDDLDNDSTKDLIEVCEQLVPITHAESARRLFWVAAGTLDAYVKGSIQRNVSLKQSLAKVEREIKRLADGGDAAFRNDPPIELTRQLLYFVAHEGSNEGRIAEIRNVFGLDENLPKESELAHARGSLTGHNRALLSTVAGAIKEDLLRVKDALDLHLRTPTANVDDLSSQVEALDRIGDTLGMLGLGVPRRVVQEQRTAINDVVSGERKADESTLLDIAGALLYVEASLDDQVARLGQDDPEPKSGQTKEMALPSSEARKVLDVLLKEAATNFAQARQCFVAFVETHWDHRELADVPRLLEEVSGALRVIDIQKAPDYLTAVKRFTENELLGRQRVPNGAQMDRLADTLSSLEYYLEAVRDRRPNREQILEVSEQSLSSLGYWPLPVDHASIPVMRPSDTAVSATPAPVTEPALETAFVEPIAAPVEAQRLDVVEQQLVAPEEIEVEEVAVFEAPVAEENALEDTSFTIEDVAAINVPAAVIPAAVVSTLSLAVAQTPISGFDESSEDIDDEIREVFSEELEEEIANLEQLLPAWRRDPNNAELLRPIRRVYHTLKGSGRLVGAKALGEFSWRVETLLNRVLDGSRLATPAVISILDHSFNTLPLLRAALNGETVYADLKGMEDIAEKLTAGEEVFYQAPTAAAQEVSPQALADGAATPMPVSVQPEVFVPEALAENIEEQSVVEENVFDADVASAVESIQRDAVSANAESDNVFAFESAQAAAPSSRTAVYLQSDEVVEFSIDPVLFEILKPEVAGHLETVDRWLADNRAQGSTQVSEQLLRSVHTMNGAFGMTEVITITDVTAPLEAYLKRAMSIGAAPNADAVAVIEHSSQAVRQTIAALDSENIKLPVFNELSARIHALRDSLPESGLPTVPTYHEEFTDPNMPVAVNMGDADVSGIPAFTEENVFAEEASGLRVEENLFAEENVFAEESVFAEENVFAEESVFAEEPSVSSEIPAFAYSEQALLADEDSVFAEENVFAEESVFAEERSVSSEIPAFADSEQALLADENSVFAEENVFAEESVFAEEPSVSSEIPAFADSEQALLADEDSVFAEENVFAEESVFAEEPSVSSEIPAFADSEQAMVSAEQDPVYSDAAFAEKEDAAEAFEVVEQERMSLDDFLTIDTPADAAFEGISVNESEALEEANSEVLADQKSELELADFLPPALPVETPMLVETPAPEFVGADDALSAMIAAYGGQAPVAAAALVANQTVAATVSEKVDAVSESDDVFTLPAQTEDSDVTDAALADEDYLGMSMEELEALTAPESGADAEMPAAELPAVDAPAFADVTTDETPAFVEDFAFAEAPAFVEEAVFADEALVTAVEETAEDNARLEAELSAAELAEADAAFAEDVESNVEVFAEVVSADTAEFSEPARVQVPLANDPRDPDTNLDMSDLDPELLDIFLEEAGDILDHSDGVLAKLRDDHTNNSLIIDLQRDLHTLKGGARMSGIFTVGDLGHSMESLLEAVAEGRRNFDVTGLVLLERGFDRLHGMVTRVADRKAVAMPSGLIAQFDNLAKGLSLDVDAAAISDVPVVEQVKPKAVEKVPERDVTPVEKAPVDFKPVQALSGDAKLAALKPLSAPTDAFIEDEDGMGARAPQEQVRIRADLLDKLVNYAGEVAIYRARLEQQLGAFRGALGELGQTTTRLREQLRRLEIETEAQIVARYQREGESSGESFDPLELDRFTTQQQLSRSLSESANDLINLETTLDDLTRQYETLLLQQARVSSDLQEGLMRTRMVPFDAMVPRLRRVLRQAATDTGKQVQLKIDGASGEMDRNVLDRMTAPLEHMLRNSMAHGLESPEDRRKAKKSEEGTVRIVVQREGSEVVLKIIDDGRGLNKHAIRAKAIERGLLAADAEISDSALYAMILESGFSTAESVSRLAGRGVGMDVVYSEIRQLGGTLQIQSEEGKGSEFIIRLPFTLAVTQAVFVKIGDTNFAVPIASVQGVGRLGRQDLDVQLKSDHPVFSYAGEDYIIHDLGRLIGHGAAKAQDSLQMPLLLARSGDLRAAICVDQVMGSREIVVKPVGPQVNTIPGIFGATIMGDGKVVIILDVAPLVRRYDASKLEHSLRGDDAIAPVATLETRRIPAVMVVDDSITMRKVTGRVLERNNFEVLTAKDGVDAVEKMAERRPDLVLLDIEMPRMDGYEVATHMRADPRLKDVPIIMITSRTGDKHRQRAMDIGVDRYLGKPYQENELMRNVFEILGMESVDG
jgi:chemosensory pili system protein ChpA (sensor histidine kinase/response regulator)